MRQLVGFALTCQVLVALAGCSLKTSGVPKCKRSTLGPLAPQDSIGGLSVREFIDAIERPRTGRIVWKGGLERVITVNAPSGVSNVEVTVDVLDDAIFVDEPGDRESHLCPRELFFSAQMRFLSDDMGLCDTFDLELRGPVEFLPFRSVFSTTLEFPLSCGSLHASFDNPDGIEDEILKLEGRIAIDEGMGFVILGRWGFESGVGAHEIAVCEVN